MAIIKRSAATDNPNIEIPSTPEQIDVLSAEALMEALQGDDLEQNFTCDSSVGSCGLS